MNTAVLFLIFNRPDTTQKVFDSIRTAKPPRLYVAADGPRDDCIGESELCNVARQAATAVDWECEIKILFREKNVGCRQAVSGAIDWFFEQEEEGIILEDDCLPDPTWFRFAEELLERYRNEERIMCVSGVHFHGDTHPLESSYFFSIYNHCWGWASWRRAWEKYDRDMAQWPRLRETDWLLRIGGGSNVFRHYWRNIFDLVYRNLVDTWDYQWTFSCWAQGGLTVLPARNLITNIGFGEKATHTKRSCSSTDGVPLQSMDFPLRNLPSVMRDLSADQWTARHVFGLNGIRSLVRIITTDPRLSSVATAARSLKKKLIAKSVGP